MKLLDLVKKYGEQRCTEMISNYLKTIDYKRHWTFQKRKDTKWVEKNRIYAREWYAKNRKKKD